MLGLDPGLRRTGYAVAWVDRVERAIQSVLCLGTIETERQNRKTVRKTSDDLRRAHVQSVALQAIIDEHDVDVIAMELSNHPLHVSHIQFRRNDGDRRVPRPADH